MNKLDFPEGALLTCIAVAILCACCSALAFLEDSQFVRRAARAEGKIVGVHVTSKREQREGKMDKYSLRYLPLFEFKAQSGQSYTVEGRYDTQMEDQWRTGTAVKVLYPPTKPSQARLDDPSQIFESFRLWRNLAVISLIVGVGLYALGKYEARPKKAPALSGEEARRAYFGE